VSIATDGVLASSKNEDPASDASVEVTAPAKALNV